MRIAQRWYVCQSSVSDVFELPKTLRNSSSRNLKRLYIAVKTIINPLLSSSYKMRTTDENRAHHIRDQ